ncbi:MAG: 1-pyrroline-5-carboxylate dehydrogenase [Bacteroidia bacterium]|nr:MAG: 1-pyrroline-5-carboxylate dehydrogenase [Bacteroidia bacterium]
MSKGYFNVPPASNEKVYSYAPGTIERKKLQEEIAAQKKKQEYIPMIIDGKEVTSDSKIEINPPHDRKHVLGYYYRGDESHVRDAIQAALKAKEKWAAMSWEHRASIFLKAANLLSGPYRYKINAATMLAQSKNPFQAEIDSACELIDFFRFNVEFMAEIYTKQPASSSEMWNRVETRPLEGFVFALSPFNFTSIAGNLPTAPAMMGNTVVWKASNAQVYSARVIMEVLQAAGLPDGVINMVFVPGPVAAKEIFTHKDFAGIHFTGSTEVFNTIWKTIGENISNYRTYPRIVGETGGKNFILMHKSAIPVQVATAITRGGFEYQGQKCSAASRVYIPRKSWDKVKEEIFRDLADIKMGGVEDFSNFFNAVIDEKSFDKLAGYIDRAKESPDVEIIAGGNYDKTTGYFIEPTILLTSNPHYETMEEELFGPIVTVYLYDDDKFEETIELVDNTSIYGLTGSVFSQDRYAIEFASKKLVNAAGNFYINDKPTGAVVNRQPFGGARASGTNDKAGSIYNLLRWVSPRTIKESFLPDESFKYPFMQDEANVKA